MPFLNSLEFLMNEQERLRRRRVQRKRAMRNRRRLFYGLVLLVILLGLLGVGRLLKVREVTVQGVHILRAEQVQEAAAIHPGQSLYGFSKSQVQKRLKGLAYVKEAKVRRTLFGKVRIDISERVPVGQIFDAGGYVLVDDTLTLLQATQEFDADFITMQGIHMKSPKPGKILFTSDKQKSMGDLVRALLQSPVREQIQTMHLTEKECILTTKDQVRIVFESYSDGPYKVKQLEEVLKKIQSLNKKVSTIYMDRGDDPIAVTEDIKRGDS